MDKIVLSGTIAPWAVSAKYLREQLEGKGDVEVHISSYGGHVFDGFEMYNILKAHEGKVTTVITSKAMSIASIIFLAGDVRKAYKNATFMGHKSSTIAWGTVHELATSARVLSGIDDVIANEYATHNGKTKQENLDAMRDEMWYIGEDQLLESGFVDEIIDATADDHVSKEEYDKFTKSFAAEYVANKKPDLKAVEKLVVACGGECMLEEPQPASADAQPTKESNTNLQGVSMDLETLRAEHPDLVASIAAAAAEEARANERERFAAVYTAIPKAMRDNEKVMAKANDPETTVEAIKAFMYDIHTAQAKKEEEAIEAANDDAMMSINPDNVPEDEADDEHVAAVERMFGGNK